MWLTGLFFASLLTEAKILGQNQKEINFKFLATWKTTNSPQFIHLPKTLKTFLTDIICKKILAKLPHFYYFQNIPIKQF